MLYRKDATGNIYKKRRWYNPLRYAIGKWKLIVQVIPGIF